MSRTLINALKTAKSFNALNKVFEDFGVSSRECLYKEEERAFVEKCFDLYEKEGFTKKFHTPYDDKQSYEGKEFTVLGRVSEGRADLCTLPIWQIKFSDGNVIDAYPEEIAISEVNEQNVYKSGYGEFDIYTTGFAVGDKAFILNKGNGAWSEGVISDVVESNDLSEGETLFVATHTGSLITSDESYYIGIETKKKRIEKPALNVLGYFSYSQA